MTFNSFLLILASLLATSLAQTCREKFTAASASLPDTKENACAVTRGVMECIGQISDEDEQQKQSTAEFYNCQQQNCGGVGVTGDKPDQDLCFLSNGMLQALPASCSDDAMLSCLKGKDHVLSDDSPHLHVQMFDFAAKQVVTKLVVDLSQPLNFGGVEPLVGCASSDQCKADLKSWCEASVSADDQYECAGGNGNGGGDGGDDCDSAMMAAVQCAIKTCKVDPLKPQPTGSDIDCDTMHCIVNCAASSSTSTCDLVTRAESECKTTVPSKCDASVVCKHDGFNWLLYGGIAGGALLLIVCISVIVCVAIKKRRAQTIDVIY